VSSLREGYGEWFFIWTGDFKGWNFVLHCSDSL
jgi:hypothetical protein